ncbi:hypothetical protein Val02_05930 [Virgisporangium aliadipatigenens]|uniref:Uncharacterized protein n=1 Tax=Virgisporangium aliadipatigenens TaxID=741659 RepID=A0A8J4DNN9_9ACTN|nr:hypothetical protein [Virgisporangium aliadipatigenens]GIJ43707.1 hypothetical protein Val02_05930 [Virgisporangium aliadipatigenens]
MTFARFLADGDYDGETVVQACRYLVAIQSDDLPTDEMRRELADADSAVDALSADAVLLEQAALATLSMAWQGDEGPAVVKGAFDAARGKLPVIEVGIVATAVMYGLYLVITKGVRSERTVVEKRADGSTVERRAVEYFGPAGPLRAITGIVNQNQGPQQPGGPVV